MEAGKAIKQAINTVPIETLNNGNNTIGEFMGFKISVLFDSISNVYKLKIHNNYPYYTELSDKDFGTVIRIENTIKHIEKIVNETKENLSVYQDELKKATDELEKEFKEFPKQKELDEKMARLVILNNELNMG